MSDFYTLFRDDTSIYSEDLVNKTLKKIGVYPDDLSDSLFLNNGVKTYNIGQNTTTTVTSTTTGINSYVLFKNDNFVYVGFDYSTTVVKYDYAANTFTNITIPVASPRVCFSDNNTIFITYANNTTLTEINLADDSVTNVVFPLALSVMMNYIGDSNNLYLISNNGASFYILNRKDNTITTLTPPSAAKALGINSNGIFLFCANGVTKINKSDNTMSQLSNLTFNCSTFTYVDFINDDCFAVYFSSYLYIVNVTTQTSRSIVSGNVSTVIYARDSNYIYAGDSNSGKLYKVDINTFASTLITFESSTFSQLGTKLTQDDNYIYTINYMTTGSSSKLYKINKNTNAVTTITVPNTYCKYVFVDDINIYTFSENYKNLYTINKYTNVLDMTGSFGYSAMNGYQQINCSNFMMKIFNTSTTVCTLTVNSCAAIDILKIKSGITSNNVYPIFWSPNYANAINVNTIKYNYLPNKKIIKQTSAYNLSCLAVMSFNMAANSNYNNKFLVSIDKGNSWVAFNGSNWINVNLNAIDFDKNGMSLASINSITSDQIKLLNNFNNGKLPQTISFAVLFDTFADNYISLSSYNVLTYDNTYSAATLNTDYYIGYAIDKDTDEMKLWISLATNGSYRIIY